MGQALQGNIESLRDGLIKIYEVALQIRNMKKSVIASIHNACAGSGWNLDLLCDFRIATQKRKIVQSFINVGFIPVMGGSYVLTKLVGAATATELLMTGKMIFLQKKLSNWGH